MCSIFYPGEIFLENASCYRVIAQHTRRSMCPTENVLPGKPRARTRGKVVISCSTFSNADHCYTIDLLFCIVSYLYIRAVVEMKMERKRPRGRALEEEP